MRATVDTRENEDQAGRVGREGSLDYSCDSSSRVR
jgi:hypothetical protein